MTKTPDDQDKERAANRARYLVEGLSSAISAGNIAKAAGLIKQLEGIPSELLPPGVSLSGITADFESAKSNSNSGATVESAAEAARKAKEEEERKMATATAAMAAIESSTKAVHDFLNRDDVKKNTALNKELAEKIKRGESLSETNVRDFTEGHIKHGNEEIKLAEELLTHPTPEEKRAIEEKRKMLVTKHGLNHEEVKKHDEEQKEILAKKAAEAEKLADKFGHTIESLNQDQVKASFDKEGLNHAATTQTYDDLSKSLYNNIIAKHHLIKADAIKVVEGLIITAQTTNQDPIASATPKIIYPKKLAR